MCGFLPIRRHPATPKLGKWIVSVNDCLDDMQSFTVKCVAPVNEFPFLYPSNKTDHHDKKELFSCSAVILANLAEIIIFHF